MRPNKELEKELKWIVKNWDNIPDKFKQNIKPNKYSNDVDKLKVEGHIVVLLVDRQKPSIPSSYDFDEERFGINRFGEIIWGFDSGCSCPSPWDDSYPKCYNVEKTWKEFVLKNKDSEETSGYSDFFDLGFQDEVLKNIDKIKKQIK